MSHSQMPQARGSQMRRAMCLAALTTVMLATNALAWPAEATRELAVREGPGQHYPQRSKH